MLYNAQPENLGVFEVDVEEYFSYHYLPIKMIGSNEIFVEDRLKIFEKVLGRSFCDFIGKFGLDEFKEHYIYLTAKHQYQREGSGFNRPNFHSDGFMSKDYSYIWSNKQPTVFNSGDFNLSDDDKLSMVEMSQQADESKNYSFGNCSLLGMDDKVIHKVGEYEEGNRCFVKVCFSKDIFALKGNSINHLIDYNWDYKTRTKERNPTSNT